MEQQVANDRFVSISMSYHHTSRKKNSLQTIFWERVYIPSFVQLSINEINFEKPVYNSLFRFGNGKKLITDYV